MNTFEFTRPADAAAAVAAAAQAKTAQQGADVRFLAGGTTLHRPDEAERRNARAAPRHQPPAARQDRSDAGRRAEDRRHRSELGSRPPPDGAAGLCRAVAGHPRRRVGTAPQHGDDRRQPAPADAVRVLPRHRHALQQARARDRLPGHHRQQPHARRPRHERALHRDQPVGHVRGDGGAGGDDSRAGAEGYAGDPDRRLPPSARQHAAPRNGARAGRPHHARDAPAARRREQAGLSEAARPGVVRVRPGLGRRRDHGRGRERDAGTHRAGRRGHQALAIARGRSRARRPARQRGELPQGGGGGPARRQAAERERVQDRAGQALPHARPATWRRRPDSAEDRTCQRRKKPRRRRRSAAARRAWTARSR